ncbi:MAG: hypothetical protein JWQ97_247 [Phenylobacterium sp.]|nr:hypothetical protein [Phenylobacterium sp.]
MWKLPLRLIQLRRERRRLADVEVRLAAAQRQLDSRRHTATLASLGYVTQAWAAVEIVFDVINWAIANTMPKKERFPVSFGPKLDLFKRGHNQLVQLANLRTAGAALAQEALALSLRRNELVHGFALGSLSADVVEMQRHAVPRAKELQHILEVGKVSISRDAFQELGSDIGAFSQRLVQHGHEVIAACDALDKVKDLARQLGIADD